MMRTRRMGAALLLTTAVALAGCGTDDMTPSDTAAAPDAAAEPTEEPAETQEPEAEPAAEGTTRDAPLPAGAEFGNEDWTVTVAPTTRDAGEAIAAENEFNDPPAEGRQFVMTEVTATYTGDETGTPWVDLSIEFVGSQGNTFGTGSDDYCGVIPNDLSNVGEMHNGASGSGNVCVSVPADQIEGGVWSVSTWFGSPVYIALD